MWQRRRSPRYLRGGPQSLHPKARREGLIEWRKNGERADRVRRVKGNHRGALGSDGVDSDAELLVDRLGETVSRGRQGEQQ